MAEICTIKLLDEVNAKIDGLNPAVRRKCVNALSYILPYARHTPSFKLGRWNGKQSFFSVGGATYTNLLDRVLPIIEEAGYQIELEDHRLSFDLNFDQIDENVISHITWPATHSRMADKPIILEPHQVKIINTFLANPQSIQMAATGAGKSVITAILSQQIEKYGRTIVIVPSKSLVEQTLETYLLLGLDAGVYYGDQKDWNKKHTICTWQSLEMLLKKTKANEVEEDKDIISFVDDIVAVIVDEAHQARAAILTKLLSGIFRNVPIRLGLTGTIPKEELDKVSLVSCIGEIFHGVSSSELQEVDFLSKCEIEILQTQEINKFNNFPDEYKFLTTNTKRINALATLFQGIAEEGNTLILVNRIETGEMLHKLLPDSVFLDGSIKTKARKAEYDLVATQDNKIIIATFGIAAVGLDIPRLFNVITFESGKAFVRVMQSLGRGLRKALDKDFVKIYDICSATKYSKKHLTERKRFYREANFPFHITKLTLD